MVRPEGNGCVRTIGLCDNPTYLCGCMGRRCSVKHFKYKAFYTRPYIDNPVLFLIFALVKYLKFN